MKTIKNQQVLNRLKKNNIRWDLSRKQFIRSIALGTVISQMPLSGLLARINDVQNILSEKQLSILSSVQDILFPADDNGPGASDIHATEYLLWVMSDPEKDPEETKYIIDGIGWVDESAGEMYSKNYLDLTRQEKEALISTVSKEGWGESWLSVILTFIFEALLADPQYGGNPDGMGWKWLNFIAGQPRPTPGLLYPEILTTIHKP